LTFEIHLLLVNVLNIYLLNILRPVTFLFFIFQIFLERGVLKGITLRDWGGLHSAYTVASLFTVHCTVDMNFIKFSGVGLISILRLFSFRILKKWRQSGCALARIAPEAGEESHHS
jgi:hypothetical protein